MILSLFPGIGLLDMAFEQEGYCIVRGPDVLWGGDIRRFHPPAGVFQGVIGGPPCQMFSALARLVEASGHKTRFGNLIPEFERCVLESQPRWFLMENVPAAPEPTVAGYGVRSFMLDNSALDSGDGFGQEQRRVRRFSFGMRGVVEPPLLLRWIDLAVFLLPDASRTVHNSLEAKTRKSAVVGSLPPEHSERKRVPAVTTGGGERPNEKLTRARSERKRVPAVTAGHDDANLSLTLARRDRYRLADAIRLQGLPDGFLDNCALHR